MKPWEALAGHLVAHGPDTVFGLPADDLGLIRAIEPTPLRMVLCRDQRNAVFMAAGWALQSGQTAVCVVGKGPALANALTGVLEAHAGGVPLVLIASGTGADRLGSGAFQELDQMALVRPLVKWAYRIDDATRVIPAIEKAFLIAATGGPVYVELPDHLLDATVDVATPSATDYRRPVILVGGGMRHRNPDRIVERFAEHIGAAIFTTASGRGVVDESHPLFCGLAGLYSPEAAHPLWSQADHVIALASRLEETATFGWPPLTVVQVNVNPVDISTGFPGQRLVGDAVSYVKHQLSVPAEADPAWLALIASVRDQMHADVTARQKTWAAGDRIHVGELLAALHRHAPADRILVQENGLQDMWSYFFPYWACAAPGGSIVPSEQTSLGFGAAAANGVQLAAVGRQVIALVGDGAFRMAANDIGVVPGVLYIVLCNGGYGWLQHQHGPGESRFSFVGEASLPVIEGALHIRAERKAGLDEVLVDALEVSAAGRTVVVEVPIALDDVPPGIDVVNGDFPHEKE